MPIPIPGRQPNALVVHGSVPFKTFKESIGCGKKNSGTCHYDSGGVGSRGSSMWRCSWCPRACSSHTFPTGATCKRCHFSSQIGLWGLCKKRQQL